MKKPHNHIISAMFAIIVVMASCFNSSAQKTTRRGLRPTSDKDKTEAANVLTIAADTIVPDSITGQISVAGYDKPLRSSRETFFISNNTLYHLCGLRLGIEYLDTHRRTLHQREIYISLDIPPGATRQASTKSWDIQKTFYYKLSPKPKRSDGTMYDVKCTVISATIKNK